MRFNHCGYTSPWRVAYAHADSRARNSTYYENRQHRGAFGVRRPLRYLSYRLDLDEHQVRKVAAVMDVLKTEREQADLDQSRTVTNLAELVTDPDLSMEALQKALAPRVDAAQRLQLAVARAVKDIAAVLDDDQRREFAFLLNSKAFSL